MKKITKTIRKTKDFQFIVDLTNVNDPTTMIAAFGFAKQEAGLPMLDNELDAIIVKACELSCNAFISAIDANAKDIEIKKDEKIVFDAKGQFKIKKSNIFKRFWNWITRKK